MGTRDRNDPGPLFGDDPRREVQDELEFHLEHRTREFMAAGMDEESARRAALERIGDLERVRGECADLLMAERRWNARRDWFSDLRQDIRFALRGAARAPVFSLMAVVTLALGIGANSAVFGVVKSVLLNALPYAAPDRLMRIAARFEHAPESEGSLSPGTVYDIAQRQRSFTRVAAAVSGGPDAIIQGDGGAATVRLSWIEPDFFGTLGVAPTAGRLFNDEDALADTARVVILTDAAWRRYFGGDAAIVNRSILVNSLPRTVIGVLPSSYIDPFNHTDIYLPMRLEPLLRDPVSARGSHFLQLVGRRGPDVSAEAAAAEIATISAALATEHPRENSGVALVSQRLQDTMIGDTRTPLLVLMASAGLVLLMACANLAAALLSRTITRRREFAVRISLGAGRGRLIRQLLAESLLLGLVGGALGLLLAYTGLAALRGADLDAIPEYAVLALDPGAVAFTFVITLITGTLFGLAPALSAGREQPQTALRIESRSASESIGARRLRGVLVAGQVALCLSLLAGAGLLARSLWLMATAPLGFEPRNTLTFDVPLSPNRYSSEASRVAFNDQLSERLAALPGVTSVAMTNFLPTRVQNYNGVVVLGRAQGADDAVPFVLTTGASESYFETMRIPVVAGRVFTQADRIGAPRVAVISEAMARRFWPEGNALGSRIRVGPNPQLEPFEVIGIVRDVRTGLAHAQPEPMLYMALRQGWFGSTYVVRTSNDPTAHVSAVREQIRALDAAVPMANIATLEEMLGEGLAPRRLPMLLMLTFGALALLLACIGIYALFANMAASREREFGVRMALGSSRAGVAKLVLRQGASWMGLGVLAGALGVYAVSRALRSLVFGIAPLDGLSIAAAVVILVIAATVALVVPVHRATRADPASVIR